MKADKKIDRRQWLKMGLGATMGGLSATMLGCESNDGDGACEATQYETMGPFHPNRDQSDKDFDLTQFNGSSQRAEGEIIYVRGKVTDEDCHPVKGAVIMIWQANKYGKYTHEYDGSDIKDDPHFQGWGQVVTNEEGEYGFKTVKPGAYPLDAEKNDWRTPHIHFKVSRRGYHELISQMYFEGEALNEKDIFASTLSDEEREQVIRSTAMNVQRLEQGAGLIQFDLVIKPVRRQDNDERELDQFVGKYSVNLESPELEQELLQFYGGERETLVLTITKEDGVLFAEMPIQPKSEIFLKSKDRYNYRAFEADIEFQRNEADRVTGLVLHRHYEFPTITAERIE